MNKDILVTHQLSILRSMRIGCLMLLVFISPKLKAQNESPYALFGDTSNIHYSVNTEHVLYIKNEDSSSAVQALAYIFSHQTIILLGKHDSIFAIKHISPRALLRFLSVDPMAHKREWVSPFNFVQNNPIRRVDLTGAIDDNYIFNENGEFVRIEVNNKPDKLVIENSNSGARHEFNFADNVNDPKAIRDGTICKVVFVDVKQVADMLGRAGAFEQKNRENSWDYIKNQSLGGKKLDFSFSSIPKTFKEQGASLVGASPLLFIPIGDDYAHNHMNFGNFLWASAGHSLGYNELILRMCAHYNSYYNSSNNGYPSQLDSNDDQLSISRGVKFSRANHFRDKTWMPENGLSEQPKK